VACRLEEKEIQPPGLRRRRSNLQDRREGGPASRLEEKEIQPLG
jgi:hypothetical protein